MGSVIFKRPPLRKLRKEGMFGVDMHFHTMYSMDGVSKIERAIKIAKKKGIGFAVTDHNEIKGAMLACRQSEENGCIVLPGIEVTCRSGAHLLSYFHTSGKLEEFFKKEMKPKMSTPFKVDMTAEDILARAKKHEGITCAPHPFGIGAVGIHKMEMTKQIERALNAIEVINGYSFRRNNMNAAYWAASTQKCITGGSDGHATIELGKVLTFTKGNDKESILKEILKNKSVVIGKEDGFLLKAIMALRKEGAFIKRSRKQHLTRKLIRSQLGPEYSYLKQKYGNGKIAHFLANHHIVKTSAKMVNTKK
jgi:hypothetical protein